MSTENLRKKFMRVEEMADYLGLSVNTIRSWIRRRCIPYAKLNGAVRFDRSEIDNWIEQRKFTDINASKALDIWVSSKN